MDNKSKSHLELVTIISVAAIGLGYLGLKAVNEALKEDKRQREWLDSIYGEGYSKANIPAWPLLS